MATVVCQRRAQAIPWKRLEQILAHSNYVKGLVQRLFVMASLCLQLIKQQLSQ